MSLPLQITFNDMESSEVLEKTIGEHAKKLNQFADIMRCSVVIRPIGKHQHKGRLYKVSIDLILPGRELAINRDAGKDHAHEDVYVAIRDAFSAARRRLEDYSQKRQLMVKAHEVPPHGRVSELNAEQGYGRIETPEGRQIYFHRNSVLNDEFPRLKIGSEVRFAEEQGEEGPQASTVRAVGKHRKKHLEG